MRLVAVLGAAALGLLVIGGVAAPSSAQAYWSPSTVACSSGAPQCYVWRDPQGVIVEGIQPITQTEFENLAAETVATIDEVAGRPTTGIASVQVEAGKSAAAALETEADTAVLAGAEDAVQAVAPVASFSSIGSVVLAAGAVAIGWEIGNAIDGLLGIEGFGSLFGGDPSGPERWQAGEVLAVSKGERLGPASESPVASADGFLVLFRRYGSSGGTVAQVAKCEKGCAIYEGVPSGFGWVLETSGFLEKFGHYENGYYFQKAPLRALKPQSGSVSSVFPGADYYRSSPLRSPGPSLSEQQSSAASRVLENPEDQAFIGWLLQHDGVAGHSELLEPGPLTVTVPDCDGLLYAACADRIEAAGLQPTHHELGWREAVLSDPPETVEELSPARSTEVEQGSAVTVVSNPDESGMPVVIPPPGSNETYGEYVARLNPALAPHEVVLGEINESPSYGPNAVTGTNPGPGTRVDPAGTTPVDVAVNPATAPVPSEAGSGSCSAGVGAIDWGPLNQPLGGRFPFGVFAFFTGWLSSWESGSGQPPEWTFTILPAGAFGSPDGLHVHVNLGFMGPVVSVARVVFLFAAFVGLLWFLATAAAKLQGDSS